MPNRPTRAELEHLREDGTYEERVRSAMRDFCFTIDRHEGRDRVWFGDYTITINRNVSFNFFARDVRDDPGLEPYPVIKGERTETPEVRIRPNPDDPSADFLMPLFFLDPAEYKSVVESMERIKEDYGDLRILPDTYFGDEAVVKLIESRLLAHPKVKEERGADWPPLIK